MNDIKKDIFRAAARKKPGKIIYPSAYKEQYFVSLAKELSETFDKISKLDIPRIIRAQRADLLNDASFLDLIFRFFTGIETYSSNKYLKTTVSYISDKIDKFNEQNVRNALFDTKIIENIAKPGNTIERLFNPLKKTDKDRVIDGFISNNLDLIKTVKSDLVEKSKQTVINKIKLGDSPAMISEKLESDYQASIKRAQFIAEDQVNKYTSDLTEIRHKALGIKRYTYRTMKDERVRDDCKVHEGNIYSYDSPPPGGKPGVKPNCRCFAEAKTSDLWDEEK